MALIKCPECGKEISNTCDHCIHCGYSLKRNSKDKSMKKTKHGVINRIVIISLLSFFVSGFIVTLSIPSPSSYKNGRVLTCKRMLNDAVYITDIITLRTENFDYYLDYSLKVDGYKMHIWGSETVKDDSGNVVSVQTYDDYDFYKVLTDGSLEFRNCIFQKDGWRLVTDYQLDFVPLGGTIAWEYRTNKPSLYFSNSPCFYSKLTFTIATSVAGLGLLCFFGMNVYKKKQNK